MELKDYVNECVEMENRSVKSSKLRFFLPTSTERIVKLYNTYNGDKSKMHPLDSARVDEYLEKGFAFVGAKYNNELIGIAVSRQFPENYPYFTLPRSEQKGPVYTLGGLYVRPDFQGKGIATKLSRIAIHGTENFGWETRKAVGIGYEVSYDNERSLNTLTHQGNFIGYYFDKDKKEGLSILLYRPFHHPALKFDRSIIKLTHDETTSLRNLKRGLTYMGRHQEIGGVNETIRTLDDGNVVTTRVINHTVDTVTEPVFSFEK